MSGTDSGTAAVAIIQTVALKRWMAAQKLRMAEESWQPGNSVSRVARQNGVRQSCFITDVRLTGRKTTENIMYVKLLALS